MQRRPGGVGLPGSNEVESLRERNYVNRLPLCFVGFDMIDLSQLESRSTCPSRTATVVTREQDHELM